MIIGNKRNLNRNVFAVLFMDYVFSSVLVADQDRLRLIFLELCKGFYKWSGRYFKMLWLETQIFGFSSNNLVKNQLNLHLILTCPSKLSSPQGGNQGLEIPEEFVFQFRKNQGSC